MRPRRYLRHCAFALVLVAGKGTRPAAAELGELRNPSPPTATPPAALGAHTPSWILDNTNWQRADGLLPAAILERVKTGDYWYAVASVAPDVFTRNYSEPFWQASRANAGKYAVDPATCGLQEAESGKIPEFYFGYPFPAIEAADPMAACKIAWNVEAANSMGEGQGASFTLNGVDAGGESRRVTLWLHAMAFLGRHGGPIDNPEHLRSVALAHALEPFDLSGAEGLSKRSNDWDPEDKTWVYVAALRRVRRVDAAARSHAVAGLDIFADDLNCYGGKTEYYRWKLVGEQTILAPLLPSPLAQQPTSSPTRFDVALPSRRANYETPGARGVPWLVVENLVLVPRPVWIVEGESGDQAYNFGKAVMYIDKDMYRIYWKLVYDRAGEYFYNAMCAYHWSMSADATFSAVTPDLVVGVNDKANRACLAGRYSSQFIERNFPPDHFSFQLPIPDP